MMPAPRISPPTTPAKILIVEDEGLIAGHISSLLTKFGYQVVGVAESSDEALAKVLELGPELLLMDIRIKGAMDGVETVAKIRERSDIAVIYLTAHSDRPTIDRAKETAPFGFLTKPVHQTNLANSIEMAIHKHRADQAWRHQRAWLATVVGTIADAMIVTGRDRKVQFLNASAEALTGWTNQDAQDVDVAQVLRLSGVANDLWLTEILSSCPQEPCQIPAGMAAESRTGEAFQIEGEIAPSLEGGKVIGSVITFRDATVRLARENELRHQHKMQAVGRFAAGIAHDFNNLLFIILGYAEEMLRVSKLNDSDQRAITEIKKAGENASGLIKQLLTFGRKEDIVIEDVYLNDVIADMEGLFRALGGPLIEWQFNLHAGLGTIRADANQMKQVLMNLVANARDAMPAGGKITIDTVNAGASPANTADPEAKSFIEVSVSDTGTGMSPETAAHLFEPFFTTKKPGKGTGLGLSIVYSITTDLGGTIEVESGPGKGATFRLRIPRSPAATNAFPDDDAIARGPANPATVLLVLDSEGERRLLRDYLAASGYLVLEAGNLPEAVRIVNQHEGPIDLLITQVITPAASGFEAARELTQLRAGLKILFISGYPQELVSGHESPPLGARFLPRLFAKGDLLSGVSDLLGPEQNLARSARYG